MKTNQPNVTNVQTSLFCNNSYQRASFNYNGTSVEFRLTENVMLNATQMAKPFGKKPKDWLKTGPTKQFLFALQQSKGTTILLNEKQGVATEINSTYHSYYGGLVIGQHGGANPGTWMHEDVAIEFARWLNPKFAIWCNDRIKEILRSGNMPVPVIRPAKAPKATKALPEPLLIDGVPVEEYFKMKTSTMNDRVHAYRTKRSQDEHVPFFVASDIMNFTWYDEMSVAENLKNMVAFLNNNTLSAWFLLYKCLGAEKREAEMRNTLQGLVDGTFNRHHIFPNT